MPSHRHHSTQSESESEEIISCSVGPKSTSNTYTERYNYCPPRRPKNSYPDVLGFRAMITPLDHITVPYSGTETLVAFQMRRKNLVVTLQWEQFSGTIGASGVSYLTVRQTICSLPSSPVRFPINITYNSIGKTTFIEIYPGASDQIRIYLDPSGTGTGITQGTNIVVYGSAISWITT